MTYPPNSKQKRSETLSVAVTPKEKHDVERIMSELKVNQSAAVRAAIRIAVMHIPAERTETE